VQAKRTVEEFVARVTASSEYLMMSGVSGDFDRASAMLAPFWIDLTCAIYKYEPQIIVTLPIFRLFSREAQVGIMAHEFAHAVRAARLGRGWHKKMLSRYAAEERLANSIAVRWGFRANITAMRRERREVVGPRLELRGRRFMRQLMRSVER
jgi:hypothetical protein